MEEISRVEMYTCIKEQLEDKTGEIFESYQLIASYLNKSSEDFIDTYIRVLDANIRILTDIEWYFLAENIQFGEMIGLRELKQRFQRGIANNQEYNFRNRADFFKSYRTIEDSKDVHYLFTAIIKYLTQMGNDIIDVKLSDKGPMGNGEKIFLELCRMGKDHMVFLSHAYDDRLYTWSLFLYFLSKGVFLYIDWMWCGALDDGAEIKTNLRDMLSRSSQLLFLRTPSSEFSIRGSGNIRGWCSWELGTFYAMKPNDCKFYIELYKRKGHPSRNRQLDGIRKFSGIYNGHLI